MYIFNNVFDELNNIFYGKGGYKSFPLDLIEVDNGFVVIAELPGVEKENVSVSFEDGILTIEASRTKDKDAKYLINERDMMHLKRTVTFGDINEDSITGKLENGLLTIMLKTKTPEEKPKKQIVVE